MTLEVTSSVSLYPHGSVRNLEQTRESLVVVVDVELPQVDDFAGQLLPVHRVDARHSTRYMPNDIRRVDLVKRDD